MANTDLLEVESPTRSWRAPWYCFFGRCSALDWLSCCTAYWLPCVAFGVSSSKTLRVSFWREFLKVFLVLSIVTIINLALSIVVAVDCPREPYTPGEPVVMSSRCVGLHATLNLVHIVSFICAVIWAIFYGGPRRTQMRQKMGISDAGAGGDCCTCCYNGANKGDLSDSCLHYWCLCCALAQEMRTVLHLEAEGQLNAAPVGYSPLLTTVPDEQGMSRAKKGGADSIV